MSLPALNRNEVTGSGLMWISVVRIHPLEPTRRKLVVRPVIRPDGPGAYPGESSPGSHLSERTANQEAGFYKLICTASDLLKLIECGKLYMTIYA